MADLGCWDLRDAGNEILPDEDGATEVPLGATGRDVSEGVGRSPDASELADGVEFGVEGSIGADSEGEPLSRPSLADVVPNAVAREAVECEARVPSVRPDLVVEAEDLVSPAGVVCDDAPDVV